MRKISRILSVIIVILSLLFTWTFPSMAASSEASDNTPYDYPVKPGSDEWKSFTEKAQKVEICQIPEEKLQSMTTEALLETVLNYPLLSTFITFNSTDEAYNVIYQDFNGLRELLDRDDVTEVFIEKYSGIDVNKTAQVSSSDSESFLLPSTLEFLLVCDQLNNGDFTVEETEKVSQLINKKNAEKMETGKYSTYSNIYSNFMEDKLESEQGLSINSAGDNWTPVSGIKTPKGSNVTGVYKRSPDYTTAEKNAIANDISLDFPNAKLISSATVKYNCHSYAWYQQSTSNPYWINDAPDIYIDDGSYKLSTDLRPRVGYKAYYNSGEHSGVVQKIEVVDGSQVFFIQSKWGEAGLYLHYPYDTPYTESIDFYLKSAN